MHRPNQRVLLRIGAFLLPILSCSFFCPLAARCQANVGGVVTRRGFQIEIDVTIRDGTRDVLAGPADVKLYCNGTPCEEGSASSGRIRFIMNGIGVFTVTVDAPGYKRGQKEVKVSEPDQVQVEINLDRDPSSSFAPGAAGNPILAPKAREALDKGMRALRDDKLNEAEEALDEVTKLAPSNPNVLYMQGLLNLKKHDWVKAQSVLEKATQIDPNSARALAALGMALCNQKKYAEAIPPLEKSVQLDAASGWETHWSLAQSYYHNARFDEALKASQQAQTESNGRVPHVDLLVAQALSAVGRYEDAATVLRDLLKNHSDDPEAVTARRYLDRLIADGKIRPQ